MLEVVAVDYRDRTINDITTAIYGADHTDSQRRGVARAVSTLAARGLIRTGLSARRFRDVAIKRSVFVPSYLAPEEGRLIRAHMRDNTEHHPVPVPELMVRMRSPGSEQAALNAAIAED